jgi:hypothetical protein
MEKKFLVAVVIACSLVYFISGCKKETKDVVLEPITLVKPDTLSLTSLAGKVIPVEVKFTTDRPISFVTGKYEIDTTQSASHVYTYPDTLFAVQLDSDNTKLSNKYSYSGSYTIPDTLQPNTIVRFRVDMKAQTLNYQKEFKVTIR